MLVGTAYYLSPEQAAGRPATPASDVYALGVVAYECLTGTRPFSGENPVAVAVAHQQEAPPSLPDDIPAPVQLLVQQALEKSPARRPTSAAAFGRTALALRDALRGTGTPEPGGMAPVDLLRIVRQIALETNLVAMDVVEVSPPYDHADLTVNNAHRCIWEVLAALASRHRSDATGDQPS